MGKAIVITSIHGITESVERFIEVDGWDLILVGDKKTPSVDTQRNDSLHFLSVDGQRNLDSALSKLLPYNHYARKNLGYIYAASEGYDRIADSDDDNSPKEGWSEWIGGDQELDLITAPRFPNVYEEFTDDFVWPRGYPLSNVRNGDPTVVENDTVPSSKVSVVQGLADIEPDVDAIYRLLFGDTIRFDGRDPIVLDEGVYSPFNSQNSLWHPEAFAFLYLPSTVTFRFTDILRSYVAQRGLWAMDKRLGFIHASVEQNRNPHDLMVDFQSEVPCYTSVKDVADTLDEIDLDGKPFEDLRTMYDVLAEAGVVEDSEIQKVDAWSKDMAAVVSE